METKICKPIFDSNVFEVADLAEDYKSIEQVAVNMNDGQGILSSYGDNVDLDRLDLIEEVQEVLENKLNNQQPIVTVRDREGKFEELKPVVPQFVADWYEENKDFFECNLYEFFVDFNEGKLQRDLNKWFADNNNKPIETLVKMKLFGYEVEKEKLYIVEIPNPNDFIDNHSRLARNYKGKVVLEVQDWLNTDESYELTEAEIKEDFEWAWQFAKEVNEDE